MYAHVLIAVSVILMWELVPPAPWARGVPWAHKLGIMGISVLSYAIFTRLATVMWMRKKKGLLDVQTARILHSSLVQRLLVGAAALYGLEIYVLGWKEWPGGILGPWGGALRGLIGIGPFLLCALGVWWASFPGSKVSGRGRGEYVWAQAGLFLPAVLPWLFVMGSLDLLDLLAPGLRETLEGNSLWSLGVFVVLIVVLALIFPGAVIRLWRCQSLPPGPLREELESFLRRHRFEYRDIRLWKTLPWGTSTAGVIGIVPRARYILVTPSLLDTLEIEELQGVMAHEMGHIRYGHMLFYLVFMAGLAILIELSLRAAPLALVAFLVALEDQGAMVSGSGGSTWDPFSHLGLFVMAVVLGEALLYLRFGFGLFSRNFERQADLHAMEVQGGPWPLVSSLEKLGGFHPLVRSSPSWHHFSIEERIRFLLRCFQRPQLVPSHHRKVRLLKRGYLIVFTALVGLLVGWEQMDWEKKARWALQKHMALRGLERNQGDPMGWFIIGTLALQKGDIEGAYKALSRSLELDPENPETLNNLAWLHATAPTPPFRDPVKALELALRAARLKPQEPQVLDTLAESFFINGFIEEAIQWEKRALSLAKGDTSHYLRQLERFQKARNVSPR